ncbi:MAG: molecular chaperone HtpG [Oscillospiraceae bacterium]|nr:molecular chaperone HtpG [Oscillospiraceae bacterium]
MAKKQFKAESKRLMDLMINSIYTHKEIFLREIISNASDAVDKLAYKALTDDQVKVKRKDFGIVIVPDKTARTLTVSDNGIGMTREELESNLGTIAKSGSFHFKQELGDEKAANKVDVIGQFGVGFYSAFMVADRVSVISKAYGSDEAWMWQSEGADGYTVTPCEKAGAGTDIIMHIKDNANEENYDQYLESYKLQELIHKYSDYIRYPIRMEVEDYRMKEKPADAGEDYRPEWESVLEWKTVNSMVPIWQRQKSKVKKEDYDAFYKEKFGDWQEPLCVLHTSGEGAVEYKALLYIPSQAPYDFYTRDYEKGLQLYSSGVLIMDKCADLLPDHFRFVRGVVDSPDFSLNISREMLQHTRQLKVIAANLEKKVKAELLKLQKDDREKYEKFWEAFGMQIKVGVVSDYGQHKDLLRELLLFRSSAEGKNVTLNEYKDRMSQEQPYYYYASGESADKIDRLPQVERIRDKGYEILYLTQDVDEFVMQALGELDGKKFKSVSDEDALPQSEEEKKAAEEKAEQGKEMVDFVKQTLGEKVKQVRISKILKSGAVCMTAEGSMTLEMEKYLRKIEGKSDIRAERVLELNPDADAVQALRRAVEAGDEELAGKYAKLLYGQALLLAELPMEEPADFAALVCELMK